MARTGLCFTLVFGMLAASGAAQQQPGPRSMDTEGFPYKGSETAPIVIVEFSDYQ